jgi:hypothetical protein
MMRILWLIIALGLAWGPMLPGAASAAVVGRLTQVKGRVDILKGGKLPATPVKVGDRVDAGDVLRSKSLSRAQITFIDSSVISISPGSRLAIEEYMFEPGQGKRRAILQLFQGLAHVLVNKIFKVKEPDFIIKTHTAVTGVRGTDFGIRLHPNASTILNFEGVTRVGNIFPEVHTWERRAAKIAYQPPPGGGSFFAPGGFVDLFVNQGTTVQAGLPPTLPFNITPEDRQLFMNQMGTGLLGRQGSGSGGPGGTGGGANFGPRGNGGGASGLALTSDTGPGSSSLGLTTGTGNTAVTLLNTVTVPPVVTPTSGGGSTPTPTPPGPTPSTFSFTQQYYGAFITLSDAPYTQSTLVGYSWGQRTGVYDGYFYALTEGTRTTSTTTLATGTNTATATGTVTGFLGGTLTGTMTWTSTIAGTTITRTGDVKILSTGELTYVWTDTLTNSGTVVATGSGTTTQTPGTHFTQTLSGQETTTTNLAGNQATTTNSGDLTGTRVMNGISSDIKAGFSVTSTAPNANTFTSKGATDVVIASEGVLGPPDASGVRVGVMTSTATTYTDASHTTPIGTSYNGGPVREVPASGDSPAATFKQVIGNSVGGSASSTLGISAQTTNPSAAIITSTYEGSGTMASSSPYTTGTFSSTGWGIGSASDGGSSYTAPYTGSMTATVTQTGSGTLKPGPEVIQYTGAAVVLQDPSDINKFQGPAQGVGISPPHTVIAITGTATGDLSTGVGTTSFNGTFVSPDSKGTLTSGNLTVTPGTYFQQTTNTGTGQVTFGPVTGSGPYTQTSTPAATMTRTVGLEPPVNQVLSGSIASTTSNSSAFPSPGTVSPTIINIQGVVAPGGTVQSGNMTMTTHPASGGPVSTYMGPVTINTATHPTNPNVLNATVVGKNPAILGVNRAPATQTGTVTSHP